MNRRLVAMAFAAVAFAAPTHRAGADITAFLGATPTGTTRPVQGIAAGLGLVVVGAEVEVARIGERANSQTPGLTTGMANVLVQTPLDVGGVQLYGTLGGGMYRETLGAVSTTSFGANAGGGVKLRVAGPLRLRLDYRLFRLRGDAKHTTYHRAYAGAHLSF